MREHDHNAGLATFRANLQEQLDSLPDDEARQEFLRREKAKLATQERDLKRRDARIRAIGRDNARLGRRLDRLGRDMAHGRISRKELIMIRSRLSSNRDEAIALSNGGMPAMPSRGRWRTGALKLLIVVVVLGCVVEFWGVPHLRTSYQYRGPSDNPTIISARYWSVTGVRDVSYIEMGDDMPLVAMLPLDKSLLLYGKEGVSWIWQRVRQRIA